ncbi:hypothetical protein [Haloplanus halophilus]|uniref:hypothetical protein n=1 Tax=Haloplanus halophilus TaxID=2949993 RepID=UPI0020426766|nr:hypothetical protein [Haloplanus sp. GDY1]
MSHDAAILEQLPPEKLLDTSNYRVIRPAIGMMETVEIVEQYLEYERANRNRGGIIRRLIERRDAISEERGETPPHSQAESGATSSSTSAVGVGSSKEPPIPSSSLLALVHEQEPAGIEQAPTPPSWTEL